MVIVIHVNRKKEYSGAVNPIGCILFTLQQAHLSVLPSAVGIHSFRRGYSGLAEYQDQVCGSVRFS